MIRKATAEWKGNLKEGKGTISGESGAFSNLAYSFAKRFESEKGTNPEELIAAAHAGCFAMALSGKLAAANLTAENIMVTAGVSLDKLEAGWTVTAIHLDLSARVPNADTAAFQKAAEDAKAGCPISRLLAPGAKITLDAKLEPAPVA